MKKIIKHMNTIFSKVTNLLEFLVSFFLKVVSKIVKKDLLKYQNALFQFIKFGIVGLTNTLISYFSYLLLLVGLKRFELFSNFDFLIAQIFSFVIGVIWSFYWNNQLVFNNQSNQNIFFVFLKVFISYSFTGLFLNSMLLMIWVKIFHVSEYIAPIINLLISVPLNFILNKKWAFND